MTVDYVVGSPGTARLSGPDDDLDLGAGLGAAGITLGLWWAGRRAGTLARHVRGVHRAHAAPPQPAVGLLTAGPDDGPLLLVGDPRVTPVQFLAVPLETPLPRGTARAFTAAPGPQLEVRGRPAEGELVVAQLAGSGTTLLPRAGSARPDAGALLQLLDTTAALARSTEEPDR